MSSSPADVLAAPDMDRAGLEAECVTFTRHLAGIEPSPYVVATYLRAHEPGMRGPIRTTDDEEDPLVLFARGGAAACRLADVWAARYDRNGPLRRKLVLLVAILESGRESDVVDRIGSGEAGAFVRGAVLRGLSFLVTLVVAFVVVGPRALVWGRRDAEANES